MKFLTVLLLSCSFLKGIAQDYNIQKFGAKADDKTMNTAAIQAAINSCSKTGGRVVIPEGTYLSGTLYFKDNVTLHLMPGAILKGSPDFKDYPDLAPGKKPVRAFIYASAVHNIGITGKGTINGNGQSQEFQLGDDSGPKGNGGRPVLLLMKGSKDIDIFNVRMENSAFWMQNYVDCENLHVKGITVYNHVNWNNDGIDIDSKNVLIEDCVIDSDDDALCLKSHDADRPCENVTIRNCIISSNCNGIKFGTASLGGFRNINISNITIHEASIDRIRNWQKNMKHIGQPKTVIGGIAIENVDGGKTDNITISNIFMTNVQTPIFIKLGNRGLTRGVKDPGHLRNVSVTNVTAESYSKMTSHITGLPGYDVENVQLNNIRILSMGTGTREDAQIKLPENPTTYPENRMFGYIIPAGGLFVRHVNGLIVQNCSWLTREKDDRPVIILDDVKETSFTLLRAAGFDDERNLVKRIN
ncbi:MAG: glycoside hydrolase family 28 [Sphingobacteriales bacterium]|nr:glycoside hydrolase family 28 [Sphingobacteriales bacterium]